MKRLIFIYLIASTSVFVGEFAAVDTKGYWRVEKEGSPCPTCEQNKNQSTCKATAHLAGNLIEKLAVPFFCWSASGVKEGSPCPTCEQNKNQSTCKATAHLANNLIEKLARPFFGRSSSEVRVGSPCPTCKQNENQPTCKATAHLAGNLI